MANDKRMMIRIILMVTVTGLMASGLVPAGGDGAGGVTNDDWPRFRLDYCHSGFKDGAAPDTNTTCWTFDTGTNDDLDWVVSSPMVVDDHVYIGADNGRLYKLTIDGGLEVWNYSAGDGCLAQFWSSPCVDAENGLVFCHASGVHAVDMETGQQVWHMDTNTREFSSPVVYEGVVYVGSYSKVLYALDEFTGDVIWRYRAGEYQNGVHVEGTGGAISTTVAISDGVVYGAEQTRYDDGYNYCDYNIFALPTEDPDGNGIIDHDEILWKYEVGEHVPVIDSGIPGDNGDCFSSPSVNEELGQVYIGSRDQNMYAFAVDPQGDGWDNDLDGIADNEGELLWKHAADNEIYSTPSIHDGNIFFGSGAYALDDPGTMYCLSESDGSEVWSYYNRDEGFLSSALVADGKVFMGCNDDRLYAFNETDGGILWAFRAESERRYNAFGSSPTLYRGTIVAGCCNNRIYAFSEVDDGSGVGEDDDDDDFLGDLDEDDALAVMGLVALILIVSAGIVIKRKRWGRDREPEEGDTEEPGEESWTDGGEGEPGDW